MSVLKKGPEIKLSSLKPSSLSSAKVPEPLKDIYFDLKERRLLPLVAILLVGIVAVPIALSETTEPSAIGVPSAIAAEGSKATTSLVVTPTTPPLRDYKKRLQHRTPLNPFRQAPQEKSTGGSNTVGESSSEGGVSEGSGESSGGTTRTTITHHTTYYEYAIDVRTVPLTDAHGKKATGKPYVRHGVTTISKLPDDSTPAFTFMGVTKDATNAVMLVSDQVNAVFGDNPCIVGSETCQLLALEPNTPETVAWGNGEKTFRIELLDVTVKETDAPSVTKPGSEAASPGSSTTPGDAGVSDAIKITAR